MQHPQENARGLGGAACRSKPRAGRKAHSGPVQGVNPAAGQGARSPLRGARSECLSDHKRSLRGGSYAARSRAQGSSVSECETSRPSASPNIAEAKSTFQESRAVQMYGEQGCRDVSSAEESGGEQPPAGFGAEPRKSAILLRLSTDMGNRAYGKNMHFVKCGEKRRAPCRSAELRKNSFE